MNAASSRLLAFALFLFLPCASPAQSQVSEENLKKWNTLDCGSGWSGDWASNRFDIGNMYGGGNGFANDYASFYGKVTSAWTVQKAAFCIAKRQAVFASLSLKDRRFEDLSIEEQQEVERQYLEQAFTDNFTISLTFSGSLRTAIKEHWKRKPPAQLAQSFAVSIDGKTIHPLCVLIEPDSQYFWHKYSAVSIVFPRTLEGQPILKRQNKEVLLEFSPPYGPGRAKLKFSVATMVVNGELVY